MIEDECKPIKLVQIIERGIKDMAIKDRLDI